jgi:pimeloyl-ACP methyl ester carboxylesterase
MMTTLVRWARWLLGGVAVLAGAGCAYQMIAEVRDKRKTPPLGRLVAVNGHRLHIHCTGVGNPSVILDAGLSCSLLDWSRVQPAIARVTHVCAYDRAGYGWSDAGPRPRTSQHLVNELHTLLKRAGIAGPYILVGHSFGGLNVRLYASTFPDEVAGLVLVDAAHEDQRVRMPRRPLKTRLKQDVAWQRYRLNPLWARIGLLRLRNKPNGAVDLLPSEFQQMGTAIGVRSRAYDWIYGESAAIPISEQQLRDAAPIRDLPLAVVSAHVSSAPAGMSVVEMDRAWQDMQRDLAGLSSNSTHLVTEKAGHMIHLEDPELVIDAIVRTVAAVRGKLQAGRS